MRRLFVVLLIMLCAASVNAQEEGIFGDVVIRCNNADADVMASLRFEQPISTVLYTVRVYGLDGLQPAFAWETTLADDLEPCREGEAVENVSLTLAGDSFDTAIQRAELNIDSDTNMGTISIAFAALNGTRGRFIAFIDGFTLEHASDTLRLDVDAGAYAIAQTPLLLYMFKTDPLSRLDPLIEESVSEFTCDDAGRRGCERLRFASEYAITDGIITLMGGRFDAGFQIEAGDLDVHTLELGSRAGRTSGSYAIVIVGEIR